MTVIQERSEILRVVRDAKVVAVVGISTDIQKASHSVTGHIVEQDRFRVYLVNPVHVGKEVLGRKVLSSLKEVPEPIDIVDVFRRPDAIEPIFKDALDAGARLIWLQPGTENQDIIDRYQDRIMVVKDACLGVMTGAAFARKTT